MAHEKDEEDLDGSPDAGQLHIQPPRSAPRQPEIKHIFSSKIGNAQCSRRPQVELKVVSAHASGAQDAHCSVR